MTRRLHAPFLALLPVLAACSQVPPRVRSIEPPEARYVDVAALTGAEEYSSVQVLTSVPLRHISAVDAEAQLQSSLPEGVRMSRAGQDKNLLLQGPGDGVLQAIKVLEKLDAR